MNKLHTLIYSVLICTCLSCQQQTPQTQIEQTAIDFCEAFYNFNYPVAKEWSTPSSQSYLSFLASNVGQPHLEQLKTRGAAKVSVISSEVDANLEEASVVCQIKNAFVIHPIGRKMEYVSSLQDTLELVRVNNKWLIRKDIPQQNGKQSHD